MRSVESFGRDDRGHQALGWGALSLILIWPLALSAEPVTAASAQPPAGADRAPRIGLQLLPAGSRKGEKALLGRFATQNTGRAKLEALGEGTQDAAASSKEELQLNERARGLELKLDFRGAARVWRQLLDLRSHRTAAALNPQGQARIQLALGAAQAESGERSLAIQGFRSALALDAETRLGPEYPPTVRDIFSEALALGPSLPQAPEAPALRALAQLQGLAGVLWIAVGRERGGPVLVSRLSLLGAQSAPELRRRLSSLEWSKDKGIDEEISQIAKQLRQVFPPKLAPKPWWRRRAAWVGAGSVLLASSVAVLLLRLLTPARVDVVIQH